MEYLLSFFGGFVFISSQKEKRHFFKKTLNKSRSNMHDIFYAYTSAVGVNLYFQYHAIKRVSMIPNNFLNFPRFNNTFVNLVPLSLVYICTC